MTTYLYGDYINHSLWMTVIYTQLSIETIPPYKCNHCAHYLIFNFLCIYIMPYQTLVHTVFVLHSYICMYTELGNQLPYQLHDIWTHSWWGWHIKSLVLSWRHTKVSYVTWITLDLAIPILWILLHTEVLAYICRT